MPVFIDDAEPLEFLKTLAPLVGRGRFIVHVFCLVQNHYHPFCETHSGDHLGRQMRDRYGRYAQAFNRRHRRVGRSPSSRESFAIHRRLWFNTHGRILVVSNVGEKVLDEALSLPVDERLVLVDRLLASLNLPTQSAIDRLWAEEAERRVSQIDKGEIEVTPGEDVFSRIRQKYGK